MTPSDRPDPKALGDPAEALEHVRRALASGFVARAVLAAEHVDPADPLVDAQLLGLEVEGYADEARLLRICCAQPRFFRALRISRMCGRFAAGLFVGGAALVAAAARAPRSTVLAVIPALAIWYVVSTTMGRVLLRTPLAELTEHDRRLVRGLLDVSTYDSDDTVVTQAGGWSFAVVGICLTGFGASLVGRPSAGAAALFIAAGVVIAVAGVLAAMASRRMAAERLFERSRQNRPAGIPRSGSRDAKSDRGFFTFAILVVGFVGMVVTLLLWMSLVHEPSVRVEPSEVPAGRAYISYVQRNGEPGPSYVTCPSLVASIGTDDPLCSDRIASNAQAAVILLFVDAGLVLLQVFLVKRRRRLTRQLRADIEAELLPGGGQSAGSVVERPVT